MTRRTDADPAPTGPPAPPPDSGRSANTILAAILLSRIAGLVRQRIFARYFGGDSVFGSAFIAALRMPNVLQNLLGEGTLSASFIPAYAKLLEKGEHQEAGRLAGAVFALLLVIAGALTLLGILLAPWIVYAILPFSSDEEARAVAATCIRIIFPMTGLLVLSAWALGVLNSHRHFFLPYFAPVLWNAAIIATLLLLGADLTDDRLAVALAWGALAGGALQLLVQLPRVLRLERDLRIHWDTASARVRGVVRNAGPAILGRGAVQVSSWVDIALASALFSGAILQLQYAQTLYILPVSLFGMSVAAAELPEMARRSEAGPVLRQRLDTGLRRVALLVVPSVVGFITLGDIIVDALYRNGEFGANDTAIVHIVLIGYSVGLLASTATRLYSSTLYALDDTRTPAVIAFTRVAISAALGGTSMLLLEPWALQVEPLQVVPTAGMGADGRPLGVLGLAGGAGVAAWIEWGLLRRAAAKRIGAAPAVFPGRLLLAALAAAATARALDLVLPGMDPILRAILVLTPFGALYFGAAHLLGVREVAALFRRLWRARERQG